MLAVGLLFGFLLSFPLLLQQSFFLSSFFVSGFFCGLKSFFSLLFVLLQFLRVGFLLLQIFFHLPENFDDLFLCIFFQPFLHFSPTLILLSGFDVVNDHIVEIVIHYLSYSVASLAFVLIILGMSVDF